MGLTQSRKVAKFLNMAAAFFLIKRLNFLTFSEGIRTHPAGLMRISLI